MQRQRDEGGREAAPEGTSLFPPKQYMTICSLFLKGGGTGHFQEQSESNHKLLQELRDGCQKCKAFLCKVWLLSLGRFHTGLTNLQRSAHTHHGERNNTEGAFCFLNKQENSVITGFFLFIFCRKPNLPTCNIINLQSLGRLQTNYIAIKSR